MKILYVTTVSGTINAFLVPHIHMLLDAGHSVDMACNVNYPINETLLDRGCQVFQLEFQRSPLKKENYGAYRGLKKLIKNGEYDWVHTHTPVASALARLACKGIPDVKVIYTVHGFHFFEGASLKNWLLYYPIEKLLAGDTDVLITMNGEDFQRAKEKLSTKKVEIVDGVGVDLDRFVVQESEEKKRMRQDFGFDENAFILMYAAALCDRKHQDVLIETAGELVKDIPNLKLLLLGRGPNEARYRELIQQLHLEDHVELMGFRYDVDRILQTVDVAVSSSSQEGLPVNIMEAMATGIPLVVSNCRGNRDLVKDGENGFVIQDDSPEMFADKIRRLYSDETLRLRMSQANLVEIQKYATGNVLEEMKGIYQGLLS